MFPPEVFGEPESLVECLAGAEYSLREASKRKDLPEWFRRRMAHEAACVGKWLDKLAAQSK